MCRMMLEAFSTGARFLMLLWFTSLLPNGSRDPREGNPFAVVCVHTCRSAVYTDTSAQVL